MNIFYIFILLVRSVLSVNCPLYCECYHWNGRYVGCKGKGLVSLDLDIPSSVQWLCLTNNYIDNLYKDIFIRFKLIDIELLDMDRNNLNNIDQEAFRGMNYLKRVNLSNNHIYRIHPLTFENNLNLLNLDLSSNPLRTLPEPFIVSSSLQILSIKSCHIGYLPINSLSELPSLSNLNIMNNQIIQITPNFLQAVPRLTHLHIRGNYLHCDTQSYYDFMSAVKKNVIHVYGSNCPQLNEATTFSKTNLNNEKMKNNTAFEKFQRMVVDHVTAKEFKISEPPSSTTERIEVEKRPKQLFTVWVVVIVLISGLVLGVVIVLIFMAVCTLYKRCKWWVARSHARTTQLNTQALPTAPPQIPTASQVPLVYKPVAPPLTNFYVPPTSYLQLPVHYN